MQKLCTAAAAFALLGGCTQAQLTDAEAKANAALTAVTQACSGAESAVADAQAKVKGGAANTVTSYGAYVSGACGSADAIIKVAQDPSTVAWLNGIVAGVSAAVAAPAAAPVAVPAPAAS